MGWAYYSKQVCVWCCVWGGEERDRLGGALLGQVRLV